MWLHQFIFQIAFFLIESRIETLFKAVFVLTFRVDEHIAFHFLKPLQGLLIPYDFQNLNQPPQPRKRFTGHRIPLKRLGNDCPKQNLNHYHKHGGAFCDAVTRRWVPATQ